MVQRFFNNFQFPYHQPSSQAFLRILVLNSWCSSISLHHPARSRFSNQVHPVCISLIACMYVYLKIYIVFIYSRISFCSNMADWFYFSAVFIWPFISLHMLDFCFLGLSCVWSWFICHKNRRVYSGNWKFVMLSSLLFFFSIVGVRLCKLIKSYNHGHFFLEESINYPKITRHVYISLP